MTCARSQGTIFICEDVRKWWDAIGSLDICDCIVDSHGTQIWPMEWWVHYLPRHLDYHHLWCDECEISGRSARQGTQSSHPRWWRDTQWVNVTHATRGTHRWYYLIPHCSHIYRIVALWSCHSRYENPFVPIFQSYFCNSSFLSFSFYLSCVFYPRRSRHHRTPRSQRT